MTHIRQFPRPCPTLPACELHYHGYCAYWPRSCLVLTAKLLSTVSNPKHVRRLRQGPQTSSTVHSRILRTFNAQPCLAKSLSPSLDPINLDVKSRAPHARSESPVRKPSILSQAQGKVEAGGAGASSIHAGRQRTACMHRDCW